MISTINKPWGAFTCRSSTLEVLADSGPILGLLLTFLGSQSDFHGCRTPGALMCRASTLIVLGDYGPFCGLLLTVLGSQSDVHE